MGSLWHFTSPDNLFGILVDCSLWASDGIFGRGIYFTDMDPAAVGRALISHECWNCWQPAKMRAYVRFDELHQEVSRPDRARRVWIVRAEEISLQDEEYWFSQWGFPGRPSRIPTDGSWAAPTLRKGCL